MTTIENIRCFEGKLRALRLEREDELNKLGEHYALDPAHKSICEIESNYRMQFRFELEHRDIKLIP